MLIIVYARNNERAFIDHARAAMLEAHPDAKVVVRNAQFYRSDDREPADLIVAHDRDRQVIADYREAGIEVMIPPLGVKEAVLPDHVGAGPLANLEAEPSGPLLETKTEPGSVPGFLTMDAQAMTPPARKVGPHAFVGRSDRWCEVCDHPDLNPIHVSSPPPEPEVHVDPAAPGGDLTVEREPYNISSEPMRPFVHDSPSEHQKRGRGRPRKERY